MILLDSLEVFNVSASSSFLYLSVFSYRIFKNGRLSGASFQHNSSNDQFSSGDSTVLRTAKKSCGECSPEVPGSPRRSPEFPGKLIPQICQLRNVRNL